LQRLILVLSGWLSYHGCTVIWAAPSSSSPSSRWSSSVNSMKRTGLNTQVVTSNTFFSRMTAKTVKTEEYFYERCGICLGYYFLARLLYSTLYMLQTKLTVTVLPIGSLVQSPQTGKYIISCQHSLRACLTSGLLEASRTRKVPSGVSFIFSFTSSLQTHFSKDAIFDLFDKDLSGKTINTVDGDSYNKLMHL
uniref:Uncharacterized protein n=1 Tax=Cynoglossus semilaevis TaxID=244447 RepID=A0A3P8VS42_CYNSE